MQYFAPILSFFAPIYTKMAQLKNKTPLHHAIEKGMKDSGMDGSNVNVFVTKDKVKFDSNYAFLFVGKQNELIHSLSPSAVKMFIYFCIEMFYGNFVEISQKQLSIQLKFSLRTTKNCLKELVDSEVIIKYKNENDTRQNFYLINPIHAWKGNAKERKLSIKNLKDKGQLRLEF